MQKAISDSDTSQKGKTIQILIRFKRAKQGFQILIRLKKREEKKLDSNTSKKN